MIEAALEGTPYEVATVHDSGQAMDFITNLKPYAVILDVMMPEPNGWQILQQIKSNPATASIPVIMLSVALERSVGYVLGASEFLVKPIDQTVLVKTLGSLLPPSQVETGYILAVDDEPDIREMLRQTLSISRYQVHHLPLEYNQFLPERVAVSYQVFLLRPFDLSVLLKIR